MDKINTLWKLLKLLHQAHYYKTLTIKGHGGSLEALTVDANRFKQDYIVLDVLVVQDDSDVMTGTTAYYLARCLNYPTAHYKIFRQDKRNTLFVEVDELIIS